MKGTLSLFCFLFVICAWGHAGEVREGRGKVMGARALLTEIPSTLYRCRHPHNGSTPDEVQNIKASVASGQAHR